MRSSNLEAIRRHLGRSINVKIGSDNIEWPSLGPEHLDRLFSMMLKHQDASKDGRFDASVIEDTYVLGVASMKKIYPELTEQEMREFIATNFVTVLFAIAKANNMMDEDEDIDKLKEGLREKGIGQLPKKD
jgi:hypothetical protein